ncbi:MULTISPECIES: MBL fold metallo-hydrolase [Halorussus]|uniref:MBL fold metallo-hydrolase n=1 Tax=Halorussus TaxID=1070314 RepID=UPI000E2140DE|nr:MULTISPECIES: MBL fold metallo-hydrolase [Halorussus]NHN57940.1 MBL fold metallo-hydrolase [Halorussus sp. JP-T4]
MTGETEENDDTPSISPKELHERIRRGDAVHLLDVRNRDEYEAWRITGDGVDATQVAYAQFTAAKARGDLPAFVDDLGLDPDQPVVAVCPRGEASATVAEFLRDEGFDARNLAGGMRGWARVYVATELPAAAVPGDATAVQYDRPATGCLSHLVVAGDEAAVVDPLRAFADRYVADAEERGATLRFAVDTHVHADHLSGVRRLAEETGARAVLPAGATDRGLAFDAKLLDDGDELRVGDVALTALHAPGHTTELTALRLGDLLFSGDALFVDSFGRPDLERGAEGARDLAGTLYDTLRDRLLALPDDTLVAPGHRTPEAAPNPDEGGAYAARIGAIRERLRIPDERAAFVDRVLDSLPPRPANFEDIVPANLGKESPDDETAFEMELGPNNCAVAADD